MAQFREDSRITYLPSGHPERSTSPEQPNPPRKTTPTTVYIDPKDYDMATIRQLILDNGDILGHAVHLCIQHEGRGSDTSNSRPPSSSSVKTPTTTKDVQLSKLTTTASSSKHKQPESKASSLGAHWYAAALYFKTADKKNSRTIQQLYVGEIGESVMEALMLLLNKTCRAVERKIAGDGKAAETEFGWNVVNYVLK